MYLRGKLNIGYYLSYDGEEDRSRRRRVERR